MRISWLQDMIRNNGHVLVEGTVGGIFPDSADLELHAMFSTGLLCTPGEEGKHRLVHAEYRDLGGSGDVTFKLEWSLHPSTDVLDAWYASMEGRDHPWKDRRRKDPVNVSVLGGDTYQDDLGSVRIGDRWLAYHLGSMAGVARSHKGSETDEFVALRLASSLQKLATSRITQADHIGGRI